MNRRTFLLILILILGASCKTTSSAVLPGTQAPRFDDKLAKRVVIEEPVSPQVNSLHLQLKMEDKLQILPDAAPFIALYSEDNNFVKKFTIEHGDEDFIVNEEFKGQKLLAKMALYYCEEGNLGLCLMKNVIFEIP